MPDHGRYRPTRPAAALGPDAQVETVVKRLTADCPHRTGGDRLRRKRGEDACVARLFDIDGWPHPPDDLPLALRALQVVAAGDPGAAVGE